MKTSTFRTYYLLYKFMHAIKQKIRPHNFRSCLYFTTRNAQNTSRLHFMPLFRNMAVFQNNNMLFVQNVQKKLQTLRVRFTRMNGLFRFPNSCIMCVFLDLFDLKTNLFVFYLEYSKKKQKSHKSFYFVKTK